MNFPKIIVQHKHESESFAIILYKLRELGIFRNITENDYGIDFEIEIVNGDRVEGHCIKVQVKSSDKLIVGKRNGHAKVGGIKPRATALTGRKIKMEVMAKYFMEPIPHFLFATPNANSEISLVCKDFSEYTMDFKEGL